MSGDRALLVIDVGSSSVRATILDESGAPSDPVRLSTPPRRASSGIVEIDANALADAVEQVAVEAIQRSPTPPEAVAIATQRATTVLFDRATGHAVDPALSWQDIRTTGACLALHAKGLRLLPSQSATKLAWLLQRAGDTSLDTLAFGTLDTFIAYRLTGGAAHVTDASNAAVTGLVTPDASGWDPDVLRALEIPDSVLPVIVDSSAVVAEAVRLPGAPVLAGLIGDQQGSLLGQSCLTEGATKLTFGTGGMLDVNLAGATAGQRGEHGTFPIVAWRHRGVTTFGQEAMMLSAGGAVDWLVSRLGILASAEESESVARLVRDAGGVTFVPAFDGFGTPLWDHGARGALIGISGATGRAEVVRAVLEGVAHRAADLLEAAANDTGIEIDEVRVDGGMSTNRLFLELVANATRRPVLRSRRTEATTLGAAVLAGVALGIWASFEDATAVIVPPPERIDPTGSLDRDRWLELRGRSLGVVPALSMLSFR